MNRMNLGSTTLALLVACLAVSARAATITWDAAGNVNQNAPQQVANNFQSFAAATLNSTTTINGVTFQGYSGTVGNTLEFGTSNITINNTDVGSASFSNAGTTAYGAMLNDGTYRATANSEMTVNISNLIVGQQYEVQLWMPYWNNQFPTSFSAVNSTPFLNTGFGAVAPQYIIGTFTANATTQSIGSAGNSGYALISAISVQHVVPEPGSMALAAIGLVGLAAVALRRRGRTAAGIGQIVAR